MKKILFQNTPPNKKKYYKYTGQPLGQLFTEVEIQRALALRVIIMPVYQNRIFKGESLKGILTLKVPGGVAYNIKGKF